MMANLLLQMHRLCVGVQKNKQREGADGFVCDTRRALALGERPRRERKNNNARSTTGDVRTLGHYGLQGAAAHLLLPFLADGDPMSSAVALASAMASSTSPSTSFLPPLVVRQ